MSAGELPILHMEPGVPTRTRYGTIVIVGGGCYGSYYLRQLGRARTAGKLAYDRLLVVDHDPACRLAAESERLAEAGAALVTEPWTTFFARYLAAAAREPAAAAGDAIVPSPLMPHLLYEWLADRARDRWPERDVATVPLDRAPDTPWQRASPDGTHYVSFAEWMCPVNCIEPARCPATRGPRSWTMPAAMASYVAAEKGSGRPLVGPVVFHCSHRAYGVGMIDTDVAVAADRLIGEAGALGPARVLVSTVSHCHGAVNVLSIGS